VALGQSRAKEEKERRSKGIKLERIFSSRKSKNRFSSLGSSAAAFAFAGRPHEENALTPARKLKSGSDILSFLTVGTRSKRVMLCIFNREASYNPFSSIHSMTCSQPFSSLSPISFLTNASSSSPPNSFTNLHSCPSASPCITATGKNGS